MKKLIFLILTFLTINPLISQNTYTLNGITIWESEGKLYNISSPDSLLIDLSHITLKYQGNTNSAIIESTENGNDLVKYYVSSTGSITYKIDVSASEYCALVSNLISNQNISAVYFEYLLEYFDLLIPSDPDWLMPNLEQINISNAWNYTTGNPDIIIGLIDSGTAWDHPELKKGNDNYGNIFVNNYDTWSDPEDPESGDGIDNDHNGYIDDYKGYDFYEDDNDARPDLYYEYHGTSLAGLIAAKTNNEFLVAGVAGGWWPESPGVKLLTLDVGDEYYAYTAYIPAAIDYAIKMGARILNFSWGGVGLYHEVINDKINLANSQGILMFAATGNEGVSTVAWPASHENVIAIGGMDVYGDCKWLGSNWGENTELTSVAVTACIDHNNFNIVYDNQLGTSYANAVAAGAGGLLLSYNPCLSNEEVRGILINTAWKSTCNPLLPYNYNWNPSKPGHSKKLGYGIIWLDFALAEVEANYPVTETQSITGIVNWNEKKWVDGDITIEAEATLTITDEVVMNKGRKINVLCGGKLIIDGGVITTTCQDFWDGITVYGQHNQAQIYPYTNQGYVKIFNGGKIEKAKYAIKVINPETKKGGGVVLAIDAYFENNLSAIYFAEYSYPNRSYFSNCTFTNNENFIYGKIPYFVTTYPHFFVNLIKVNYIRFKKCYFKNENVDSDEAFGNGIYSYNSNFIIDGICANTSNPCNDYDESIFYRLQYGIYATGSASSNNFSVKHSIFDNNHRSIYASFIPDIDIVSNKFDISTDLNCDGFTYGVYLNSNCTGFHIEDNEFLSANYNNDNTGIYIRNSGVMANWVHNNTFSHLNYGAIADGNNKHETGMPGLCYKCNDFISCKYDIHVVNGEEGEGGKDLYGIAEYQGTYSPVGQPNDTSAAGNTFTVSGMVNNFDNTQDWVTYIRQQTAQSNEKIEPDPANGITIGVDNGTTYSKSESCPSWINGSTSGGGIGDKLAGLDNEKLSIDSVQMILDQSVDGGNTENLAQEVVFSFPPEALELRNELLGKSPYLSDTVMKSAINKENVLPNVMIRDILVANPQSAKSEEVIGAIDERFEPMPGYMKYEILEGQDIIGAKEILEMQLGGYKTAHSSFFQSLLSTYRHDTINQWPSDSIVNLLNRVNTLEAIYILVIHYIESKQFANANQVLQEIPSLFNLSAKEVTEQEDYVTITGTLSDIHLSSLDIYELDSNMVNNLLELTERDYTSPGAIARNLLIAGGYIQYQEPFNFGEELKSSVLIKPDKKVDKPFNDDVKLNIFPNPAKEYVIVEYEIKHFTGVGEIKIYDLHGRQTGNIYINKAKDQKVIDIKKYASGSYMASVLINGQQVKSQKFNIIR